MTYERCFKYWDKLNHYPHSKYIRAQRLFTRMYGGWVRGISTTLNDKGNYFVIE